MSEPSLRTLGGYVLLERLAAYGMVQPWLARWEEGVQLCVLEHLHNDVSSHPAAVGRFARQAQLVAHLDHPNVVRVLATGEDGGVPHVVSELVLGVTLERVLDGLRSTGDAMPLPIFATIAQSILRGLSHAHLATDGHLRPLGIVHRHLAPRSVRVGFNGQVVLGDFSAARAEVGDYRTAPGTGVGSVPYMSPEQVQAKPVGPTSDIYAAAALFHELLTGRRVVPEGPLIEMLRYIVVNTPGPVSAHRDAPSALDEVIARGLEKNPEVRWMSADAFARALSPVLPEQASADATSRWVRELLPEDEVQTLEQLERVRAMAPRPAAPSRPAPVTAAESVADPWSDRQDVSEEPAEPSVMTMPGAPVALGPNAPQPVVRPVPVTRAPSTSGTQRRSSPGTVLNAVLLLAGAMLLGALVWRLSMSNNDEAPLVEVSASPIEVAPGQPRSTPPPIPAPSVPAPVEAAAEPSRQRRPVPMPAVKTPSGGGSNPVGSQRARPRKAPSPPAEAPAPPPPVSEKPPTPAEKTEPPEVARLRAELRRLSIANDPSQFFAVHEKLVGLAAQLPLRERRRARRLLDAAERAQDVAGLAEVLELLARN